MQNVNKVEFNNYLSKYPTLTMQDIICTNLIAVTYTDLEGDLKATHIKANPKARRIQVLETFTIFN